MVVLYVEALCNKNISRRLWVGVAHFQKITSLFCMLFRCLYAFFNLNMILMLAYYSTADLACFDTWQ